MLKRFVFPRQPRHENLVVADALRQETVGGAILLVAALVALIWANTPWSETYDQIRHFQLGPLEVQHWTQDGLLTIFFFVAGLELKRELVVGSLRRPAEALVPIVGALAGMAVPALLYVGVVVVAGDTTATGGWAIPTATDIAFALGVLALAGSALPPALRAFLLTAAVVDDLGAITVIAVFFTDELHLLPILGAVLLLGLYAWLQHRRVRSTWIYLPLAIACWWLVHDSGIHATVTGVLMGLLTRVRPDENEAHSPAERLEHRIRPLSAGIAIPAFALFAAGVPITPAALGGVVADPAAVGIVVGLVAGKTLGIFGGAWLTARLTRAELNPDLVWRDVFAVAVLAGVGFTVALLVCELAFADDPVRLDNAKAAVLLASFAAAVLAAVLLRLRGRRRAIDAGIDEGMEQDPPG